MRDLGRACRGASAGPTSTVWRAKGTKTWRDSAGYTHFRNRGPTFAALDPGTLGIVFAGCCLAAYSARKACAQQVPLSKRKHVLLVSEDKEIEMGRDAFKEVLQLSQGGKVLSKRHPLTRKVAKVGSRLTAEASPSGLKGWGGYVDHMRKQRWDFVVIDSPVVNACVLPGGRVCVFTGLLKRLQSDDELAFILGHEIGHVVARHAAEKVSTVVSGVILSIITSLFFDFSAGALYQLMVSLPYSRQMEDEADVIGLHLMSLACFDFRRAPLAMSRIQSGKEASGLSEYFSTHPGTDHRIERLANAAKAMVAPEKCWSQSAWSF